jgi:hypothetical protein
MMGPLELGAIALLLSKMGSGGSNGGGGWRQLAPNSKGQYSVPPGATFAVDVDGTSPVAPVLIKQLQDMGGQVLPPTAAVTAMPIDWPANDETRGATGRMRAAAVNKGTAAVAIDMGSAPKPTRVWVK